MEVVIEPSWKEKLKDEFNEPYFAELAAFVKKEYAHETVYPPPKYIFNAFNLCPFEKVKVIILGQDPYHNVGQANGLAFSVNDGVRLPPSLQNIYKELSDDLGLPLEALAKMGDLSRWEEQGVLLLNATLTVRAHLANSHEGKGWERFTDAVIRVLSEEREHLVFILWGNYAKKKGVHIDRSKHLVLTSAHPSPLSVYAGFFGSKPFSKTNTYLAEHGEKPIIWE